MSVYIISNTSVLYMLTYEHTSVSLCVDVRVPLRNVLRSTVVALCEWQVFNFKGCCRSVCTSSRSQGQLQWLLFLHCQTLIFVRFLGTKLYFIIFLLTFPWWLVGLSILIFFIFMDYVVFPLLQIIHIYFCHFFLLSYLHFPIDFWNHCHNLEDNLLHIDC